MTIILTDTSWNELWQKTSDRSKDFETSDRGKIPNVCNTYDWQVELRSGLTLSIHEVELTEDIVWTRDRWDDSQFGLSFFLSGKVRIERYSLTDETDESVGKYYSECNCDFKETEWWKAGEKFSRIYLKIEPQQFFQSFGEQELEQIPIYLRQAVIGDRVQPYYQQREITQQMWMVLSNILKCPYQGLMKRMYLESQTMELIAFHFQQCQEQDIGDRHFPTKNLSDIDRIYQAKEILLKNLESPPCLIDLARQVGLNEFKLKRGFRKVFGTSAFKYLHDYRLEQARQLLALGDMNVEEVALKIGFDSRSYFASSFRKKFGLNPKQYFQHCQKSL
jgi:AraC family transcriptional regulator, transcriptional activator of the genes for pyochelin and ferripyochelin receptors